MLSSDVALLSCLRKFDIGKLGIGKLDIGKLDIGKLDIGKLDIGKLDIGKLGFKPWPKLQRRVRFRNPLINLR